MPVRGPGAFDSQEQIEDFLTTHRLEGRHDEANENQWALASYTPLSHPGYIVLRCVKCGQPTIRARDINETRCGREACQG